MTEVNYGKATPETIANDRFGIQQEYELTMADGYFSRRYKPVDPQSVATKLGLRLLGAWRTFGGLRDYSMVIDQRDVHVRSYSDGRLKITVDGIDVFTEKVRVKTVLGVKQRWVEARHVGDDQQDWVMAELHAEAIMDNARWDLDQRRKQILNSRKE